MLSVEWKQQTTNPFNRCPKIEKINQNISLSEEVKKELIETIKCSHIDWYNLSLGWYKRCIECSLEELTNINYIL